MGTTRGLRRFRSVLFFAAAVVASVWAPNTSVRARTSELSIGTDKGGYTLGDVAAIRVSGLSECAGRIVRLGFRCVLNGAAVSANEVTLDAGGNGSTQLTLTSDNNGTPVQAAAWGDCISRGFEPGLALDPHPQLISIGPRPPAAGSGPGRRGLGPGHRPCRWFPVDLRRPRRGLASDSPPAQQAGLTRGFARI